MPVSLVMLLMLALCSLGRIARASCRADEPQASCPVPPEASESPLGGDAPPTENPPVSMEHHLDWLVVPLVNYSSDYKLGYGGAGQFQWSGEVDPYRHQLNFQALFTTGGMQSHFISYDAPHFLGTQLRLWAHAEYNREQYAPYYGLGNASSDLLQAHPELYGTHPFAFDRTMPLGRVGFSYPLFTNVHAFFFATYLNVSVKAPPGSLLADQRPYGVEGGHELQLLAGLYRNTRDFEATPSRGSLLEVSARGAARGLGSTYTYGGINARALAFFSLIPRLVLALRLEGDYLTHGTPFYELRQFGGIDSIEGVGGQYSARGIPQDRYIGRGKLIGTAELRLRLASPMVRGEPLSIGLVGFTDLARVWQFDGNDGPWYQIHGGYGVGLRLWRRAFVLRADVATSTDRAFNFYILFGHYF